MAIKFKTKKNENEWIQLGSNDPDTGKPQPLAFSETNNGTTVSIAHNPPMVEVAKDLADYIEKTYGKDCIISDIKRTNQEQYENYKNKKNKPKYPSPHQGGHPNLSYKPAKPNGYIYYGLDITVAERSIAEYKKIYGVDYATTIDTIKTNLLVPDNDVSENFVIYEDKDTKRPVRFVEWRGSIIDPSIEYINKKYNTVNLSIVSKIKKEKKAIGDLNSLNPDELRLTKSTIELILRTEYTLLAHAVKGGLHFHLQYREDTDLLNDKYYQFFYDIGFTPEDLLNYVHEESEFYKGFFVFYVKDQVITPIEKLTEKIGNL